MTTSKEQIQAILVTAKAELAEALAERRETEAKEKFAVDLAAYEAFIAAGPIPLAKQIACLEWLSGKYRFAHQRPFATPGEVEAWLALPEGEQLNSYYDIKVSDECWSLDKDPRTADAYAARVERGKQAREVAKRQIEESELARSVAKKAREEQHARDLALIVQTLGDEDAKEAWGEGVLSHSYPVELLRKHWCAPGGISSTADVFSSEEKLVDVERVSIEAYRKLRELRAAIRLLIAESPFSSFDLPITTVLELERCTHADYDVPDNKVSAYCALFRHTLGTVEVVTRYRLT